MKIIGLAIALIFLSIGSAYAQQATPAGPHFAPGQLNAIFLYGRANAFHDIVQAQHCEQLNEQAVDAINQRLENAHAQLEAHFGKVTLPPAPPLPPQIAEQSCNSATIESYSNHVQELEQLLSNLGSSN
jgi:hypothetical protein